MSPPARQGSVSLPQDLCARPTGDARQALYTARQDRVREFMRLASIPALLLLDPNDIFYACGSRNMELFCTRTPTRYLLLFAEGPSVLFEFPGCEHLSLGLKC
jgi:Xaa-Pro dipeptidase